MGASSRDVRAGGAYVEILAKDGALRKGLDNAAKTLQKWGNGINALGKTFLKIGTAALAPLLATSKVFASMGDEMAKSATRTGVSVEAISALAYAAKQSGSDLEGLENGLRKMSKLIVEAAKGGDGAIDTLRLLGLEVKDLNGLKPDQQFKRIADSIAQVQDPTVKAALAMEVFGKSGTQLIPLMADGAKGIEELEKRARELGLTWTTVDAKAAEEFGDRLDDLWQVVKRATAAIGSSLAPAVRQLTVFITENMVKAKAWIDSHQATVRLALRVAGGVAAAGIAFIVFGRAVSAIGAVVGAVSAALGVLASTMGAAGTVLSTVLFSSVGLVIAALGGLAAYLIYNSEVGQTALGALGGYFGELKDIATTALGGIIDALKSGDFALAAQILMAGIRAEWLAGIEPLRNVWAGFKAWFIQTTNDLGDRSVLLWENVAYTFSSAWAESMAVAKFAWSQLTGFIKNTWEGVQNFLTEKWLQLANLVGLVTDAELKAAKALNNKHSTGAVGATLAQQIADEKKIFDDLSRGRKSRDAEHEARVGDIGMQSLQGEARIKQDLSAAIAQARGEAAAAAAKLKGLSSAAAGELLHAKPPEFPTAPKFDAKAIAQGLDDVAKRTIGVSGTFNSAALGALGGGGVAQQQLEVQKRIERNTREAGRGGRFS